MGKIRQFNWISAITLLHDSFVDRHHFNLILHLMRWNEIFPPYSRLRATRHLRGGKFSIRRVEYKRCTLHHLLFLRLWRLIRPKVVAILVRRGEVSKLTCAGFLNHGLIILARLAFTVYALSLRLCDRLGFRLDHYRWKPMHQLRLGLLCRLVVVALELEYIGFDGVAIYRFLRMICTLVHLVDGLRIAL